MNGLIKIFLTSVIVFFLLFVLDHNYNQIKVHCPDDLDPICGSY